jgi:two-component system cell cycle sensor histidine kinase/response regulator CckA
VSPRDIITVESEQGYRAIVEAMPIAVWITDRGQTLFVNSAFERLVGYSYQEMLAPGFAADLIPPDDRDAVAARAAMRVEGDVGPTSFEVKLISRSHGTVALQCDATSVQFDGRQCVLVAARDITAQRAAEAQEREVDLQLRQAAKLESIGLLAGGVAHEFNNLLTVIIGYNELVGARLDEGSDARQEINEAVNAAKKAATLTKQLLAFASRQDVQARDIELNDVVTDTENLLHSLIGEDIELVHNTSQVQLPVHIDPGQFEQVMINLVVNARDAMPSGGRLTIETGHVVLDEQAVATRPDVEPGEYAVMAVMDTGVGIPPEHLDHIFEPFFTTKGPGKGTGLGLATCYGIVRQARGHIEVHSEPGQGTSFKIYLPLSDK